MGRVHFSDIFANNFDDFWNNSTKFSEILAMRKIHFLLNSRTSLCNLAVISIQTGFHEETLNLTLVYLFIYANFL